MSEISHELKDGIDIWVYRKKSDLAESVIAYLTAFLSIDEREVYGRFKNLESQIQYLLGRSLLRKVLSRYCTETHPEAWTFSYTKFGKPYVAGFNFDFNVSHTKGLVAIAISNIGKVGIDVEYCEKFDEYLEVAELNYTDSECYQIQEIPLEYQYLRFWETWVLKEAYLKARGIGLSVPLTDLEFNIDSSGVIKFFTSGSQNLLYQFWILNLGKEYRSAISIESQTQVSVRINSIDIGLLKKTNEYQQSYMSLSERDVLESSY